MSEAIRAEKAPPRSLAVHSTFSALLRPSAIVIGLLLLAVSIVIATSIGQVSISVADSVRIILNHLHLAGESASTQGVKDAIIWDVRLPRVLTACVVGGTLAVSGASYQALFRNPLADPFLLGVAAGAGLGATAVIVSPLPLDYYRFGYVALFAFLGATAAVLITYSLAWVGWTAPTASLVLAGIAVSAAASAGTSFLMMLNESRLTLIFAWLYGDFTTASWSKLTPVLPYAGLSSAALLLLARQLNVLQLGDDEAKALGVRVELIRAATILIASLATAVCVAIAGLIGFVGLIVPHICRLLFGWDYRIIMPMSMIGGAIFLVLADLAARMVLRPQEVPVGILTAAIGAPFFLFLLRRHQTSLSQ
jgi:iron complex transport system permease protein